MADTTKNELSRALKHQLLTKTLDNITVRDITDECHLNRQTFYYHFHDIYEKKFLEDGLRPVIAEIVDEKAAGRELSESDMKFISDVFVFILLSVTMEWLDNDMNDNLVRKLDKIVILLDGNIDEAIDRFSKKN